MDAYISHADGVVTVRLGGDIDTYTVPALLEAFEELPVRDDDQVVVDLGEVTFLDSSGIGALIALHRRIASVGGRLELRCTGMPLQLLRLMSIDQVIDVVPLAC